MKKFVALIVTIALILAITPAAFATTTVISQSKCESVLLKVGKQNKRGACFIYCEKYVKRAGFGRGVACFRPQTPDETFGVMREALDAGCLVVVRVTTSEVDKNGKVSRHYVVLTSYEGAGTVESDFTMLDPDDGKWEPMNRQLLANVDTKYWCDVDGDPGYEVFVYTK